MTNGKNRKAESGPREAAGARTKGREVVGSGGPWGSFGGGYGEETYGRVGGPGRARPPTRGGPYASSPDPSDARIQRDVRELLDQHPALDASKIDIGVHHGEVHLTGQVGSAELREVAVEVAGSVSGVKKVIDGLRVRRSRVTATRPRTATRGQRGTGRGAGG